MRITGGQVFDLNRGFVERTLYTDGSIFTDAGGGEAIDACGCYVIPGLVDVHLHGCMGEDFSDASPEGLQTIADYELSQGVTYLCPAGMTLSEEVLSAVCANAAAQRKKKNPRGAEIVGVHLEGPFLSAAKKGAQNESFLHAPDFQMLSRLQSAAEGCIRLVTVAPELPDAIAFIRAAAEAGITVSLGHTAADYDTASAAFAAGASHATHLYNGMPPLHHREPGVIGAAFDAPHVQVELICDGVHIHGSVVRATFRLFGPERVILISDSIRATGMPDGSYTLGGQAIEVRGNRSVMADQPETIAGSVTNLMGCLRQAVEFGIPLPDAVRACTFNPAQAIGIADRVGSLDAGKEATAVFLDPHDLSLQKVLFKGALL